VQLPVVRPPRRRISPFAALLALGAAGASAAPINFNGTTYNQDFQSMTGTATATSAVTVSTMTELSTLSGAASITGWYMYGTGWTTSNLKWQGADTGTNNAGGVRQLYDSTSGPVGRALGSNASGSYLGYFGLILKNTSGATIDALSLSYDAVMNRNPSATSPTIPVVNPFPLSYAVRVDTTGNFTAMTGAPSLGFSTPSTGAGAPAATSSAMSSLLNIGNISGTLSASPLGWAADQYLYIAWYDNNNTGNDATAGIDNFSISVPVGVRDLTWGLIVDGAWDSSTANFTSGGSATAFAAADKVTFDNAAGGVITLSGSLAPTSVTVSASSGTYTFNGATAADKITGGTGVVKSGAGILILTSANDFTGGVTITDGTVQIDGAGRLGSGPISLNGSGAALVSASSSAVSMSANALTVGANGGAINTGANGLTLGALTTSGILTKTGAGSLTVGTVTSNTGTGFTVSAGDLVLGQASGTVKIFANTILTGNLVLNGGIRFDVDGDSTISGTGKLKLAATGGLLSNTFGDNGGTISAEIALNSSAIAFAKGSWNGDTYTPSTTFSTTFGGTGIGGLILSLLTGDSDVDLSGSSLNGGGTGTLTLTGASTYTGNTTINAGTPAAVSVVLGVNDALPTTTGLIVGTKANVGVPVMDLNGKNQQFAYVADGANATASKYLKIVNNASSVSVLTLGGSVSPGKAFSGYISDGIGTIALVKTGGNTQILSGTGDYSGGVTVSAGTLRVNGATPVTLSTALGTGAVIVNNSGQLFVSASIANAVTVNSGGRVSGNGELDLVTVNSGGVIAANSSLTQLNAATLTTNNTATLAGKSVIEWKLNDASAAAGIGYDTFNFTIGLDLSGASAANKIMVRIISFAAPGDLVAGNPLSMNLGVSQTFDFASASFVLKPTFATNIADLFEFDVSQFRYSDGSTSSAGLWAMSFDQDTQIMTLTAVPEPSTYGVGLGALLLAAAAIRRRRRKA
jgi:autotransporter-associated beta strand protein